MKVICSYCRKVIRVCDPPDHDQISYGMCPGCYQHFNSLWSGLGLGEYLERFDAPCMVVDGEGRVLAANKCAGKMMGKRPEEMGGLLGGEVMECKYARLPEGCGRTIHYPTCTVRKTVLATISTGSDQISVPAFIEQDSGTLQMQISTFLEGDLVKIVVEFIRSDPSPAPQAKHACN